MTNYESFHTNDSIAESSTTNRSTPLREITSTHDTGSNLNRVKAYLNITDSKTRSERIDKILANQNIFPENADNKQWIKFLIGSLRQEYTMGFAEEGIWTVIEHHYNNKKDTAMIEAIQHITESEEVLHSEKEKEKEIERINKQYNKFKKKIIREEGTQSANRPVKDILSFIDRSLSGRKINEQMLDNSRKKAERMQKYMIKSQEELYGPGFGPIFKDIFGSASDIPENTTPAQALEDGLQLMRNTFNSNNKISEAVAKLRDLVKP